MTEDINPKTDSYDVVAPSAESKLLCAKVAHATNSVLCRAMNERILAFADVKDSMLNGIDGILVDPDMTPEQNHQQWLDFRAKEGWVLGREKDPAKKTHPSMMPYDMLSPAMQLKDLMFVAVVRSFFDVWPAPSKTAETEVVHRAEYQEEFVKKVISAVESHVSAEVDKLFSGPTLNKKIAPVDFEISQPTSEIPLALARDACGILQRAEKAGASTLAIAESDWISARVEKDRLYITMRFLALNSGGKRVKFK